MRENLKRAWEFLSNWLFMLVMVFGIGGCGVSAGILASPHLGLSIEWGAAIFGAIGTAIAIKFALSVTLPRY